MHMHWDQDEWELVTESRPCTACGGDMKKCNGMCNGMFSAGHRRRDPADVARIKADRLRKEEDAILARAEAIKAARATVS